jgi:hypothetical protein
MLAASSETDQVMALVEDAGAKAHIRFVLRVLDKPTTHDDR